MQTPDSRGELARLRRRAYGPDADIAGDADAVARLVELEARGLGVEDAGGEAMDAGVDAASSEPDAPGAASGNHVRRRRRMTALIIVGVAAAGIVGAGLATGVTAALAPRADATLHTVAIDPETDSAVSGQWLNSFRVARADLRAFDEYRGFRAWSGPAADGLVCLFVTTDDRGLVAQSCTAPSIHPVADFEVGNGTISLGGGPRGVVRFELNGGVVEVYDRHVATGEVSG